MRYIHCFFSVMCVFLFSRCNTVYNGRVISETTGQPLKNISITAQNYRCYPSIVIRTETDSNGNFELVIPPILKEYIEKGALVSISGENVQSIDYQLGNPWKDVVIKLRPIP